MEADQTTSPKLLEYLSVVLPHVSGSLISPIACQRFLELGKLLPATDLAGFELGLHENNQTADLITRQPRGGKSIPANLAIHPDWTTIADYVSLLDQNEGNFARLVNVIDLEFDLPNESKVPVPAVFFELNRDIKLTVAELTLLAAQISSESLTKMTEKNLVKCLGDLPKGGKILHLGSFKSRNTRRLRVVVGRIEPELLTEYLCKLGWNGNRQQLEQVLTEVSELATSVCLSIDIGESIDDRIGLECFMGTKFNSRIRWSEFLEYLQRNQLCSNDKANGLMSWPGICSKGDGSTSWPPSLELPDQFLATVAVSEIVRFLSHIKLVLKTGASISAKGYIGYYHHWRQLTDEQSKFATKCWSEVQTDRTGSASGESLV